jgi:hypothetical protein
MSWTRNTDWRGRTSRAGYISASALVVGHSQREETAPRFFGSSLVASLPVVTAIIVVRILVAE